MPFRLRDLVCEDFVDYECPTLGKIEIIGVIFRSLRLKPVEKIISFMSDT